ncbi:unnamed protein product [Oncorhynchus mykiss]|uniref:adenylate cyclase n=1 Tax=Oncorhynchus mykiss TaxID=8022 RepID=A0A060XB88_ONCMY|nr:unnamed protein product [Oncorhynchus mykiss]
MREIWKTALSPSLLLVVPDGLWRPGLRAGEGPNMVRAVHAICHLHTAPTTSALGHVRRLAHLGTRTTERGSSVTTTNNFVALYCVGHRAAILGYEHSWPVHPQLDGTRPETGLPGDPPLHRGAPQTGEGEPDPTYLPFPPMYCAVNRALLPCLGDDRRHGCFGGRAHTPGVPQIYIHQYKYVSYTHVILFADIKGFTLLSVNLSAQELARTLNELFGHFDCMGKLSLSSLLPQGHHCMRTKILGDLLLCPRASVCTCLLLC